MNAQRQIWVPFRPNRGNRQKIAEIDGELLSRANRFGGGYQPFKGRIEEKNQQKPEIAGRKRAGKGRQKSSISGPQLFNWQYKGIQHRRKRDPILTNVQVIGKTTGDTKSTEDRIKKPKLPFMLDRKPSLPNPQPSPNLTESGTE